MNENLLRYPGGKNRAVKILKEFVPKDVKQVVSIFYGGGSLERYLANNNIKIKAYDNFELLVNFWNQIKINNDVIYSKVLKIYKNGMNKKTFKYMQENIENQSEEDKASWFYILNRCSFSGTILRGGCSQFQRFTLKQIEKIKSYQMSNIELKCLSFEESIPKHINDFKYLDPPYWGINNLYQNKNFKFNHEKLYELLSKTNNWVMSYNDCEFVRKTYKDYEIIELDWKYGMNSNKKSNEIIIINK